MLRAADLFCGAGGTSIGAEQSGAAKVRFAVNHWDVAVQTHSANFPDAQHVNSRLDQVRPSECPKIDLLFASPECMHHSRARGGRPTSDQQRAGAFELMPWIEHHRPSFLIVENVVEFQEWGPVGSNGKPLQSGRGKLFQAWVKSIEACGYTVAWNRMNAADFGAATSRDRLFVVARKGRRAVHWPDPTHARRPVDGLFGKLQQWRGAWEVIDWSIPCPSIFSRSRPLADKTLLRIEAGLRRFVGPMVVRFRNHMDASGLGEPIGTVSAGGGHHGLAVPFQYQLIGMGAGRSRDINAPVPTMVASRENHGIAVPIIFSSGAGGGVKNPGCPVPTITAKGGCNLAVPYIVPFFGERDGQPPRTHSLDDAMPTITATEHKCLAVPYIANVNHGGNDNRTYSVDGPLGAATAKNGRAVVVPFLTQHYSSGGQWSGVEMPIPTIPTKDRHGMVYATIDPTGTPPTDPESPAMRKLIATMVELGVVDIGFRMLSNPELSSAQGFPGDYIFHGCKSEITRQIGNSVSPNVAKALTEAVAA